jgi:hypothetical protein
MKKALFTSVVFAAALLCSCGSAGAKTSAVTSLSGTSTPVSGTKTTAASTPAHPALQIMGVTSYIDENGYYNLVGEVLNSGDYNMENVDIIATYYDTSGKVIGTADANTELYVISKNVSAPFNIIPDSNKIQPATYKLDVQADMTNDRPFSGLTVQNDSTSIDDTGSYAITGQVKNASTQPADEVKIIATYYDAAKNVIGTSFVYANDAEIAAGHISTFELSSYPQQIRPAGYKLQIEAQ